MRSHHILVLFFLLIGFSELLAQGNQDQIDLNRITHSMKSERDSLISLYKTYSDKVDNATDTLAKKEWQNRLMEIDAAIGEYKHRELQLELDFVRTHLSSPLSLNILSFRIYKQEAQNHYPVFSSLFQRLSPSLQNSEKGKALRETLGQLKNSQVGRSAPAFSVKDINNELLSLSSYKNKKYVLLDFWASWCVPCRQDFPFLKQVYETYSAKGLEIISISTDAEKEKWIAAIKKDGIGAWKHFSAKDNDSEIASAYFVAALPVKVLIDKEGRIIGRWRGGGEENKDALERTLRSLFEIYR